jgi:hypothetical protein
MKNEKFSQYKTVLDNSRSAAADLNQIDFSPSTEEVARRAYFSYVNEGSRPGHDVQHWLAAEAHLLAERDRTRVHGFHKHSENNIRIEQI